MTHTITLDTVSEMPPALVEAIYELTINKNLSLAQGLIQEVARRLEEVVTTKESPKFMGEIQSRAEVVGLLSECITQQIEGMRRLHHGHQDGIAPMLSDHLVKLRAISDYLTKKIKSQ